MLQKQAVLYGVVLTLRIENMFIIDLECIMCYTTLIFYALMQKQKG